jgi:ParB family chromosome partitioning protein
MANIVELDIDRVFVGSSNVRKHAGDITELINSIEEKGLIQPITVRPVGNKYEVIVGRRRYEACRAVGVKKIPAMVRELSDSEAIALSLVENIQRGNITDEEEIEAMLKLMKLDPEKYGSHRKLAKALGLSLTTISRKFTAYELVQRVRSAGSRVFLRGTPTEEERKKGKAIPIEHAEMIERAMRSEEVSKLPEKELKKKRVELVKVIAPLERYEARKVVNHFKMFPEKPVEQIKEEALAKETGVAVQIYFSPKIARALSKASEDRHLSIEELVPIAVEEWLRQVGYL